MCLVPVVSALPAKLPITKLSAGLPDKPDGILIKYADVPSIKTSLNPFKLEAPPPPAACGVISVSYTHLTLPTKA